MPGADSCTDAEHFFCWGPLPCGAKGQVQARFFVRQLLIRMHSYGSRVFDFHPVLSLVYMSGMLSVMKPGKVCETSLSGA